MLARHLAGLPVPNRGAAVRFWDTAERVRTYTRWPRGRVLWLFIAYSVSGIYFGWYSAETAATLWREQP